MHRTRFIIFGITALFLTTGIAVSAQRGHSSAPKPQHTTAPKIKPPSPSTAKATKPAMTTQSKTMKPVSTKTTVKPVSTAKTTKTTKGSSVKLAKTDKPAPAAAKVAKTEKPAATKLAKAEKTTKKTSTTTAVATTPSATTTTATVALTPVQQKLTKNTNLAAKLASRLPAGTDLMLAAADFRTLGQFVSAVNVSYNLPGISFTELKTKIITDGMSLGQAIQALRPLSSATIEAQRAEYDARGMISESELQPQVTTTAPTSTTTSSKSKAKAKKSVQ
jgi:hypothetical protein